MGAHFPGDQSLRVSDSERSAALTALSQFYAEGRLSMAETDERCAAVAKAQTRADLNRLFVDLPATKVTEIAASPVTEISYTASEITALHKSGARPRAGILGLTTIGAVTGTIVLVNSAPIAPVLLALIPVVFILLYVMKIGPQDWYTPTPRQLDRQRLLALKEEEKLRNLELRAQRRERTHALTTKALDAAENVIGNQRWKQK